MYNIVLLEDNYVIRQIISIALRDLSQAHKLELKLYTSSNGVEGLGYIYVTAPNLIIVDTTLPKYSGKEVLDFLRHNEKFKADNVQVIILEEGNEHIEYPEHFLILDKTSQGFFEQLLTIICQNMGSKFPKSSLLRPLYSHLVQLASKNDLTLHANESKGRLAQLLNWPVRFVREVIISILLSVVFIFKSRFPNENIDQEHADLVQYRVKYYPTLVIGASALLLVVFQLGTLGVSQFALLRKLTEPSFAAATFTVDSTADTVDFAAGDGVCDTDDGVGDGPCTLRAAIAEANALAGADTINFNIASGYQQIIVGSALPAITEALTVDGSSQPGASCDPMTLLIALYGPVSGNGFTVSSANVTIRGMNINHFQHGIYGSSTASNLEITCNIIGLDNTGTTIVGNTGRGIYLAQNSGTQIGGVLPEDRNILSGNDDGIYTEAYNTFNLTVQGNYIGTDITGTIDLGNTGFGLQLRAGNLQNINTLIGGNTGTTPGGACTGACNVISGNNASGIFITGTPDGGLTFQGNFIGLDVTGTQDLGNTQYGIYANRYLNGQIGGALPGGGPDPYARNVISGNGSGSHAGIFYYQRTSTSQIVGNYIGTDTTGTIAIPNDYGILFQPITTSIQDNIVEANLISGNTSTGIHLQNAGQNVTNNTFSDNIIGRNADDSAALSNGTGIYVAQVSGNVFTNNIVSNNAFIGLFLADGDNNTFTNNIFNNNSVYGVTYTNGSVNNILNGGSINSNGTAGIYVSDALSTPNTIQSAVINSNIGIGIYINAADGIQVLDNTISSNTTDGIYISNTVLSTDISGNTIHSNGQAGIKIADTNSTSNSIVDTIIYNNGSLGIDLSADGVTANDAGDGDSGANNLLNYPVLTAAAIHTYDTDTAIDYSLDTAAGNYLVQFFYSVTADGTGYGEAESFLCEHAINHPGGVALYSTTCPVRAAEGSYITATTTEDLGGGNYDSTSEFALNIQPTLFGIDGTIAIANTLATGASEPITVVDADLNDDAGIAETVSITVTNDNTGELETVTLTEDSVNSNAFIGNVATAYGTTAGTNYDGTLLVAPGHNITVTYVDTETTLGVADNRTDQALVVNAEPIAEPDNATTASGDSVAISVLTNDTDPEGELNPNSLTVTAFPAHGNVTINYSNSTIVFTAFSDYVGSDSLTYEVCDNAALCDTAVVSLTISAFVPTVTPTPTAIVGISTTPEPTATLEPTPEPTVLRPTPTSEPTLEPTPVIQPTAPGVVVLPETGSTQGLIMALFGEQTLGETVATTAITLPAITAIVTTAYTYPGFVFYAFVWIKRRKKYPTWGIVYDQEAMSAIAFARVALYQGETLIQERISDINGRFGFAADHGEYTLVAIHPDYEETSIKIVITKAEALVTENIIMRPKNSTGAAGKPLFRKRLQENLRKLNLVIFTVGFIITIFATISTPILFNFIVLGIYFLQLNISIFSHVYHAQQRNWGYIYDIANEVRVQGAFVRLFDTVDQNQIDIQMTDKSGRYGFIVEPGHYLLAADHPRYEIPSRKDNQGRFFVSPTGKWFTNITVKPRHLINLSIPADNKGNGDATLPSPFGK